jgi:hypothetical protein
MEVRSVVLYFGMKKWPATEIHKDLVATLTDHVPSYPSVMRWLRERSFPEPTEGRLKGRRF